MYKVQCRFCSTLEKEWCEMINDSPDPDIVRDCAYFKQKTNGDRIRAMSDEELANLIDSCYGLYSCDFCPYGKNILDRELCKGEFCNKKTGAEVILGWLKQPVREET